MLKEIKAYELHCDGCGCVCEMGDGIVNWQDENDAFSAGDYVGWLNTDDGRWLCMCCQDKEEADNGDDTQRRD